MALVVLAGETSDTSADVKADRTRTQIGETSDTKSDSKSDTTLERGSWNCFQTKTSLLASVGLILPFGSWSVVVACCRPRRLAHYYCYCFSVVFFAIVESALQVLLRTYELVIKQQHCTSLSFAVASSSPAILHQ